MGDVRQPEFDVSPERAIDLVRGAAPLLESQQVPVGEAAGRVLREAAASLVDRPAADDSALDGYACLVDDTIAASEENPVALELIGEVAAGRPFSGHLGRGQAVRIATGGLLPQAATHGMGVVSVVGVVGVEHAVAEGERVRLTRPASRGATRPRGQDLRAGEVYLEPGTRLTSAAAGLAAAMGHPTLSVSRRPRVVIVTTGDEVVPPGTPPRPGQLFDANAVTLSSAAERAGCEVVEVLYAPDDADGLRGVLTERCDAARPPDLILTSGGVSRGEHDVVRDVMLEDGELHFWRVSMRPAGPTMFGRYRGVALLCLPGNPVSALVGFLLFGRAFVDTAAGLGAPLPYYDRILVRLAGEFRPQAKTVMHRAHLNQVDGVLLASPFANQSSGVMRSLVEADALVISPGEGAAAGPHSPVPEGFAEALDLRLHL